MKLTELRKIIREEVREAIQDELKDILLEAVRSPKTVVAESSTSEQTTQTSKPKNIAEQRAAYASILGGMSPGQDTLNFNSADARNMGGNLQVTPGMNTSGEGSQLPAGNVGLDQIMGLMNKK
jgi:hypothetical protein